MSPTVGRSQERVDLMYEGPLLVVGTVLDVPVRTEVVVAVRRTVINT